MHLYDHQEQVRKDDLEKVGLFLGTGSGKTRIACLLSRNKTLILMPKTQFEDGNWSREIDTLSSGAIRFESKYLPTQVKEMTFDLFKRDHETLEGCDTLVVDEAHGMLGVTPNTRQRKRQQIPKSSQRYEALLAYIQRVKPKRIYLCTATIAKSPFTVWAAGVILGKRPGDMEDFFKFRYEFYTRLPMPGREVWAPKSDSATKDKLAALVRSYGYTGRLEDFFDVPDQTFKTDHIRLNTGQEKRIKQLPMEYPEPIVRVGKRHQIENGVLVGNEFMEGETFPCEKIDKILEYAEEFPRMVVFAKYTAQILQISDAVARAGFNVITMTGETKNRGEVIAEANRRTQNVFVVQAQISAGWELPEYPVMIFASRTYSFVDYDQALGRIQRANNIKKNLYINLVVKGGTDEAVDKALANKSDFNERIYAES